MRRGRSTVFLIVLDPPASAFREPLGTLLQQPNRSNGSFCISPPSWTFMDHIDLRSSFDASVLSRNAFRQPAPVTSRPTNSNLKIRQSEEEARMYHLIYAAHCLCPWPWPWPGPYLL